MISEAELALIRTEQEKFMPNTVIVQRRMYTGDDDFNYQNVTLDQKCRITAGIGRWALIADRFQGITPYTLTSPHSSSLEAGDRLIDAYGRVFEVRDVRSPGSYSTAIQALLDMVTDG